MKLIETSVAAATVLSMLGSTVREASAAPGADLERATINGVYAIRSGVNPACWVVADENGAGFAYQSKNGVQAVLVDSRCGGHHEYNDNYKGSYNPRTHIVTMTNPQGLRHCHDGSAGGGVLLPPKIACPGPQRSAGGRLKNAN